MPIGTTNRHARPLRQHATEVERKLWQRLRNRLLAGFKFRRQATLGHYVVDFVCAETRLVVELDGGQHSPDADCQRTQDLERLGYRVIRFWNNEVNDSLDGVLQCIATECLARSAPFGQNEENRRGRHPSSNCD